MTALSKLIGRMSVVAATMAMSGAAGAQEKLTFNMSWLPQGSAVGVAVGVDQGWFKQAGLDVSLIRGYGGSRTANELDQGQFEVGYVDPISLVLNRANGGRIRLIGAINTQWPAGICYATKKHQVRSLDDLRGLQMGGGSASPVQNVVPAWLELNGKPRDFIRMLRLDPAVIQISLVEGKIDLAECWRASDRPVLKKQAKAAGIDVAWIEYSDYKLDAYGSGFAVRDELIEKKPEALRQFLRASYRGYELARTNPGQAADIMVKMFPTLDRSVVLDQIGDIDELVVDKAAPDKRLGYLRDDRIASTLSFIENAFDLKGKVKPGDVYTNALLPN
ncbi:MAG TPA: ABC transporter substrate-binding protein [Xanthobacteraceae bacterium]|jgi:NitT/TauT family transport system substrate-binding protein